jgi:hypothetical protein
VTAIEAHNTPVIFNWLAAIVSYQGISDAVAGGFIARHGNITWADIDRSMRAGPTCPKLVGHWTFVRCLYNKTAQTCSEPVHFQTCSLPCHALRNGRLNQTAYSLFLFIRDIANGDIVQWIDQQIKPHIDRDDLGAACQSVVDPLKNVYGLSDKVVSMAMATLLMGATLCRPHWFAVGGRLIVVDTLVHNFLARTGILNRFAATHLYGPACYRPGGCADILAAICTSIDARRFNPDFPKVFPRFVQHAIWRYCAQAGLDVCNGNQIDDRTQCTNMWCRVYCHCDRLCLAEQT